ncbi:MAG: NAD(P)H-dependent oxidoreductase subunit E [Anaerolineales bacterium]|jgi:NADH-quinone oxidoreductase subunit E
MSLAEKYPKEVEKTLAKYPPEHKRSAVMPLLYLAQREEGYVDRHAIHDIAKMLDMTDTEVSSIIGFYTLYHDKPEGALRIQVCTDLPCALRGADQFLADLCEKLGIEPGGTTSDGLITVEPVMCLAACDKAPMFQTQGPDGIKYHENMTVEKTMELIDGYKEVKS